MKEIFFGFIYLFIFLSYVNGQSFELHPTGFKDSTNVKNDYIIFNFATKKQKDLYTDFLVQINSTYVSKDDVIHTVEDHSITISSSSSNSVTFQKFYKYDLKCDLKYTLTFLFKDGKVRVNAPIINGISGDLGNIDLGSLGKIGNKSTIHLSGNNSKWMNGDKSIFSKDGELKEEKAKNDLEHFFNGLVSSQINSVKKIEEEIW